MQNCLCTWGGDSWHARAIMYFCWPLRCCGSCIEVSCVLVGVCAPVFVYGNTCTSIYIYTLHTYIYKYIDRYAYASHIYTYTYDGRIMKDTYLGVHTYTGMAPEVFLIFGSWVVTFYTPLFLICYTPLFLICYTPLFRSTTSLLI